MSQGKRMTLAQAAGVAQFVMHRLRGSVVRIEAAGSVRRRRPEVGDLELVCVPRFDQVQADLFGDQVERVSLLDQQLLQEDWRELKGGDKYKQLLVLRRYTVDLFIQPDPATWGVNFALRTGSADFARWLVTPRAKGGALPFGMYVQAARLWQAGSVLPLETPEEADFFRLSGLPWIEPAERESGRWGAFTTGELTEFARKHTT
jgi:DNA polymerase/3'-5' exonuclease PolX